ncbi:hypothetical protein [Geochorda subterranea]|uniref:Uncharacterized protein n=1 Tax=Geochorda subterranea TaxID=3109564 RepID=A0ABZ1BSH7_9FIRM|nr:hypothetical protein [Limnochorda sp. LNt]WRP15689.1 hypothetical protein VLY81_05910 [Limnochorda sp. LNt]
MATRTLLTADDLLRLPKDGKRCELVKGELVEMAPREPSMASVRGSSPGSWAPSCVSKGWGTWQWR